MQLLSRTGFGLPPQRAMLPASRGAQTHVPSTATHCSPPMVRRDLAINSIACSTRRCHRSRIAVGNCLANLCRASTKVESDGMHGIRNGSTSSDVSFCSEDMQGCDIMSIHTTTLSSVHILLRLGC